MLQLHQGSLPPSSLAPSDAVAPSCGRESCPEAGMEITKPRGVLRAVASKSNARLMSLTQNPRCPGQSPAKDRFRIPQRPLNLGGGNASSCPTAVAPLPCRGCPLSGWERSFVSPPLLGRGVQSWIFAADEVVTAKGAA